MERGTALVPEYSSYGDSTSIFNSSDVDVKKRRYEAAVHARNEEDLLWEVFAAKLAVMVATIPAATLTVSTFPVPGLLESVVISFSLANAANLSAVIAPALLVAVKDLQESHAIPAESKLHKEELGEPQTYSKITNSGFVSTKVDSSLLLEDFLYEKPFVNLALSVVDTALRGVDANCFYEADSSKKERLCEIGLYGANGEMVSKTGRRDYKEFRKSPIAFKSSSDWSSIGVKMDRWERVDGLKPDGGENPGGVPIRHVERYNLPNITVDDFIEKYSFVVDDLMPHRLRQIRMNFNFKEEIAWECDITKDPDAKDACEVFRRSGGGNWETIKWVKDSVDNGKGVKVARYDSLKTAPPPRKEKRPVRFCPCGLRLQQPSRDSEGQPEHGHGFYREQDRPQQHAAFLLPVQGDGQQVERGLAASRHRFEQDNWLQGVCECARLPGIPCGECE